MYYYDSPIGKIGIAEEDGAVTDLFFRDEAKPQGTQLEETDLLKEAGRQLEEYFGKKRKAFDLPLKLEGTEFQKRDWQELLKIPYGETRSYGEIAKALGIPKGARAVGLANNRNPVSIIVPCHRVIGADGKLVGYGGGLPIKEFLLNLEKEKQ
ncbi:MAG: methylated-DNA--[protein]-cysteine S-methyltransferase [Clostridiales bacterium]|nr:methylated-DNA--[protein]-cysteine S-methyltransferase [Clostridiales bacterium]